MVKKRVFDRHNQASVCKVDGSNPYEDSDWPDEDYTEICWGCEKESWICNFPYDGQGLCWDSFFKVKDKK